METRQKVFKYNRRSGGFVLTPRRYLSSVRIVSPPPPTLKVGVRARGVRGVPQRVMLYFQYKYVPFYVFISEVSGASRRDAAPFVRSTLTSSATRHFSFRGAFRTQFLRMRSGGIPSYGGSLFCRAKEKNTA